MNLLFHTVLPEYHIKFNKNCLNKLSNLYQSPVKTLILSIPCKQTLPLVSKQTFGNSDLKQVNKPSLGICYFPF